MATLSIADGQYQSSINLNKKSGTILSLPTSGKYIDKDIKFTLGAQEIVGSIGGSAVAGEAIAAITNTNNMANTAITKPSGTAGTDYWEVKATAMGISGSYTPKYNVTAGGWLENTVIGNE
jgi:hypothetical protein